MTTEPWLRATLGEIAASPDALQTGPFGNQLRAADYVTEGIPVVMPKDLVDGAIATEKVARVSSEKADTLPRYRLQAGDILLARRGEMGRCALVRPREEGWICGTGCLRIRPNEQIDGRYLSYYLGWSEIVNWLEDHAVGQTLPSLNTGILAKIPMTLPVIDEQRRITAALAEVDEAITRARAVVEQARRVRHGFARFALRQSRERQTESSNASNSWQDRTIGSLCTLTNGFAFKARDRSPNGLPIIRIQNLNGSNDFNFFAGPPNPRWTVESGDLLFAWAGVKGSSFGPCIWHGPRGVLNQHIFRVQPGEAVVKEWLFEALRLVTHEIEERAQGFKASLLHVRKADITEHIVPLPPLDIQLGIAARSRELSELVNVEQATLESLVRIKRGLTQDLLSGRVRTIRH